MKKLLLILIPVILSGACNIKKERIEATISEGNPLAKPVGSAAHPADLEEATIAIAESNAIYFTSFQKNDPSIFIDRYAEDACILAPGSEPMCGHDAAFTFFKSAYEEYGLRNGRFITSEIYGVGNGYVTEEGIWQSFNDKGELFDDGKFLVLWKKTEKGWKMYRDSFSSNRATN